MCRPLTAEGGRSWGAHIRETWALALPLIGAQLAIVGLGVTDTIMLGWLGAEPLAAGVLGTSLFFILFITGSGFANAVAPMVASAIGAGDTVAVRRSVRMALWISTLFAVLVMPVLLGGGAVLRLLGQDAELSAVAGGYLSIAGWALFLNLWHTVFRSYFSAVDRAWVTFIASLAGLGLNAVLNWMFIFGNWGAPRLEVQGAAVATLGTNLLITLILVVYAYRAEMLRQYEVFVRFWRPDWAAFGEVARLGWPISLALIAEVSLFAGSTVMMGWVGTLELAAHGIALQVTSVVFMVPLGLGLAATVRVGQAFGRGDRIGLRRAAGAATLIVAVVALLAAVMLLVVPEALIAVFVDAETSAEEAATIVALGVPLLAVAALFQLGDSAQVVAICALRGIKDTRVPMFIAVLSYMVLGLGSAYVLAFGLGLAGVGIWLGLAVGVTVAGVLLGWRFQRLTGT